MSRVIPVQNSCACTAHFQTENRTVIFANMRIYPRGLLCGSLRNKKEDILPSLIPICRTLLKPHGLSCRIFGRAKRSHAASLYGKGKWLQHLQIFIPIIWGLLIKIRACFLQMKRIGNISQRKFLWTILKRNARRTIILPVNTFKAFIRIGEVTSPIRAEILKAVSLQQICCHVLYLLLLT